MSGENGTLSYISVFFFVFFCFCFFFLKASLIKDKLGNTMRSSFHSIKFFMPDSCVETFGAENQKQERELESLKLKNEKLVADIVEANAIINKLKLTIKDRDELIQDLQIANKNAAESAKRLNNTINENRKKFENEKDYVLNNHRAKVESWKKDLGKVRSSHIKLEKKFAMLQAAETAIIVEYQVPMMVAKLHMKHRLIRLTLCRQTPCATCVEIQFPILSLTTFAGIK